MGFNSNVNHHAMMQDPLLNIAISSQSLSQPFDYLRTFDKRKGGRRNKSRSNTQNKSDFAILNRKYQYKDIALSFMMNVINNNL